MPLKPRLVSPQRGLRGWTAPLLAGAVAVTLAGCALSGHSEPVGAGVAYRYRRARAVAMTLTDSSRVRLVNPVLLGDSIYGRQVKPALTAGQDSMRYVPIDRVAGWTWYNRDVLSGVTLTFIGIAAVVIGVVSATHFF